MVIVDHGLDLKPASTRTNPVIAVLTRICLPPPSQSLESSTQIRPAYPETSFIDLKKPLKLDLPRSAHHLSSRADAFDASVRLLAWRRRAASPSRASTCDGQLYISRCLWTTLTPSCRPRCYKHHQGSSKSSHDCSPSRYCTSHPQRQ
jgi:hypothetical protein